MSTIEHATHSHNDSPEGNPSNLTITTNVCHPCKDLLDNWDDHDCNHNGVPHHRSIEDLEHSAMNECSICYQLWRARPVPSTLRQAQNEITELAPLNVYSKLRVRYYLGMSQLILEFHNPRSNFSSTKIIAFEVDMIHTEDACTSSAHVTLVID